jgi:hypothetical protein
MKIKAMGFAQLYVFAWKERWELAQTMYTHVSKYKNDKIKK